MESEPHDLYYLVKDSLFIIEKDSRAENLFKYIDKEPLHEQGRYCVCQQKEGYLLKLTREIGGRVPEGLRFIHINKEVGVLGV